jgi:hypothetical protein
MSGATTAASRLVEFRAYVLRPGGGARFDTLVREHSLPLHRAAGIDVVNCGPWPDAPDRYLLVRAFEDAAHRERSLAAFYASRAWRDGPRADIVALIAADQDRVQMLPAARVERLRGPQIGNALVAFTSSMTA